MPDFTVEPHGVDSSGRAILASAYLWDVWEAVVAALGFRPVITQGSWMSRVPGGGAAGSEGYHDKGGPFDLRTWNLTRTQVDRVIRVLREHGCAAWRRDQRHGGFSDPHIHFVLGTDRDLTPGAASQWRAYIAGRDGLASNGPDYEWRPSPLVLQPPEDDMPAPKDWTTDDWKAFNQNVAPAVAAAVLEAKPDGATRSFGQMVKELWNKRNAK